MNGAEVYGLIDLDKIFVSGINYKNADISLRGALSLDESKQLECFQRARELGFNDFIVLNTCNRTEIYGSGPLEEAEKILLEISGVDAEVFESVKSVKQSDQAIKHIFDVASGLDSQILGDYEILGQFKKACKFSKSNQLLSPLFERMVNTCIQASKEIKTKTELSRGTVSTSYAVIEVIKEKFENESCAVLLVGTGNIGKNIAKNLVHYLPQHALTLSNRTASRAMELADELKVVQIDFEDLRTDVSNYHIIINCSEHAGFDAESFHGNNCTRLILDLSVPSTIKTSDLPSGTDFLDVDAISGILMNSIEQRKLYLPIAHEIINQHLIGFREWFKLYKNRDRIMMLKNMLVQASAHCPHLDVLNQDEKEKRINKMMVQFIEGIKNDKHSDMDFHKIVQKFMSLD